MSMYQWLASWFPRPRPKPPVIIVRPPAPAPIPEPIVALFDAINEARADHQVEPCGSDPKLDGMAQSWADTMDANGVLSHGDFEHRLDKVYPDRFGGENVAKGQRDAEAVVTSWLNSPGHRDIMLNPNYVFMGCGRSGGGAYWCTVFTGPP